MDGKTTVLILVLVLGEQLGRRFVHPYFGLIYVPLVFATTFIYSHWAGRARRQRFAAIKALPPEQQRAAAQEIADENERAEVRLFLGLVDPVADGPQPSGEEVFGYPRAWQHSVVWIYWLCLGMAGLILAIGYLQNVAARDDFLPWLGLVLGFGGGAVVVRWSERQVMSRIFVNVSGLGSIDSEGRRRIIFWSELAGVRVRPWMAQVEFYGVGTTRKIVASFHLERFARLTEMVSARLREMVTDEAA